MTEETTSKAVSKPKIAARPRVPTAAQAADGKLGKKSVAKLNNTAKQIRTALATMDEQLVCAVRSMYIAPQLITKLTAEKEELDGITWYKFVHAGQSGRRYR